MADSTSSPTIETPKATSAANPPVQDIQKKVEPETDQSLQMEQRIMKSVGGGNPETPPDRFADALERVPGSSQAGMLRQLQRSYGNQYVGQVIQAKLEVGSPDDIYEREADQVAEQIMRMPEPYGSSPLATEMISPVRVQRLCDECEKELQQKPIQRQTEGGASGVTASASLENSLQQSKRGGSPLSDATRAYMEPRFGEDFSQVRVHTDSTAAQMNRALSSHAFTHGRDIYFGAGRYSPDLDGGKQLLAHELTHVVQQEEFITQTPIQRQDGEVDRPELDESAASEITFTPLEQQSDIYRIRLPNITLMERQNIGSRAWNVLDLDQTLLRIPTEIGVVIEVAGNLRIVINLKVDIDPIYFSNIVIGKRRSDVEDFSFRQSLIWIFLADDPNHTLQDYRRITSDLGEFIGNADLHFGAIIHGSAKIFASLLASASFAGLFELARVVAGLNGAADLEIHPHITTRLEFSLNDEGLNFRHLSLFNNDTTLNFNLNAFLNASLLGWEFLYETLPLIDSTFTHSLNLGTRADVQALNSSGEPEIDLDLQRERERLLGLLSTLKQILEIASIDPTGATGNNDKGISIPLVPGADDELILRLAVGREKVGYAQFENYVGKNIAVFKYYILNRGERVIADDRSNAEGPYYEESPNTSLHSEINIMGKLQEIQMAHPGRVIWVDEIISERKPCGSCMSAIRPRRRGGTRGARDEERSISELIITTQSRMFWLVVPDSDDHVIHNSNLMRKYGQTPPPLEDLRERYPRSGRRRR
ncbi:DUF4157 domain-containing protein [Floridanema evergladense]|uniref:DUF4157 domain-containing protein n=1 Tax=Floridaenema evergladense BLCC-F167 TaxID=3153639 RepID=A0ABV4WJU1_9CYAN